MSSFIGKGLVIYTDGGCFKGNPAPVGAGVHWYTFSNEPVTEKHFPIKGILPTTKGYTDYKLQEVKDYKEIKTLDEFVESVLIDKNYYRVEIKQMFDYCKGIKGFGTNNVGELTAFVRALEIIDQVFPDVAVVYSDSEYVIKGMSYIEGWKKNNWLTSTGKPVANKDIWLQLDELKNKILLNKIPFTVKWIKGHADKKEAEKKENEKRSDSNLPNMFADKLATIGASIANSLNYGIDTTNNNGVLEYEVTIDELKNDKNPDKIHPLLVNNRVYLTYGGRENKNIFFIGNPGHQVEDIFIGKQIPDAQIGIVYVADRDPIIEMIEEEQNKWLYQHYGYNNLMYCLNLANISSSKVYRELEKYGANFISRPKGIPNLETPTGKGLTYVHDPVFLALKNFDKISELNNVLMSYCNQDKLIKVMDITHELYDTVEMTVEKDLLGNEITTPVGKAFKKSLSTNMKTLSLDVEVGNDQFIKDLHKRKITLTCGIDMPRRNQLKAMEEEFPSVKLLIWNQSGSLYTYAFLMTLHVKSPDNKLRLSNYGIWKGATCSQLLLD